MLWSKSYVQKYLWHDNGQPFYQSWQVTLSDNEALAFLALITVLLAYTQTQAWKLARLVVKKATRPIQLPDENEAGSLAHLGQREAVLRCLANLSPWIARRTSGRLRNEMRAVSRWFGIVALGNVVIFVVLGALIPWILTSGLEIPVVQSRTWDGCYQPGATPELSGKGEKEAYLASTKYENCWFNRSEVPHSCRRSESILTDRPVMGVSRNITCPFARPACHSDATPVQLDHVNISLRDYGLNYPPRIRHSRRLTCAPLNVEHFIVNDSDRTPWLLFARIDPSLTKDGAYPALIRPLSWVGKGYVSSEAPHYSPKLRRPLSSPDGRKPNSNDAGLGFWLEERAPEFTVWQSHSGDCGDQAQPLHSDLDQLSGNTFVLAFNAGRLRYRQPINDPIYASHNRNQNGYAPDYEYTAMGCVEQHRLCIPGTNSDIEICSQFTCWREALRQISTELDESTAQELEAFKQVGRRNIVDYLEHRGIAAILPSQPNILNWRNLNIDPMDQWIYDVQAWFETTFLLFRVHLFAMITGDRTDAFFIPKPIREKICGRALFMDGDYTNVNFLGLIVTLVGIAIISVCSHIQKLRAVTHIVYKYSCQESNHLRAMMRRFVKKLFSVSSKVTVPNANVAAGLSEPSQISNQEPNPELYLRAFGDNGGAV